MAGQRGELPFEADRDEGGKWLQYRMLGPVEVVRGDDVVDLGVLKQRALLTLLLIHANEVVSTDRIIDELWGEGTGSDREKALWVVVSRLRTALEPDRKKRSEGSILLSRPPGYVLSVDPHDIDAARFEALCIEGRALLEPDPGAASLVLSEALDLWRGHALEEFMYEAFAEAEVNRLEELRLAAIEDRIDADLRTGRAREQTGELEGLVRQHPTRERMAAHLMLALHLSGRQADALRVYNTYRAHLADELGLDPPPGISRLEEQIVLDDPELRQVGTVRALAGRAEPGLSVRGYELREQIGAGAMGNVYRAFQPAVGRDVAIKVIRPELANDPAFIRSFEADARLIARLEHPQIVPVFDYWREPDSAYLVTRRFERGSLRDLVESGSLTADAAANAVVQVGGALAAAHRQGVAHGDLKPENVLVDGDDNAYVTDFGMPWARDDDGEFIAPEQRAKSDATPQADLFSLGRLAEYVIRNGSPYLEPVIARATAIPPADRYPDVDSFLDALTDASGATQEVIPAPIANPYRGLHAFDETDADRFFGRERLIERLLARLGHRGAQGRFVAVVGPSGSGKSSVVRAGVVPALRAGAVPGSDRWFIATMMPGRHPFEALEEGLRSIAVTPPPGLSEKLAADGIAPTVASLVADSGAQVVIVIDQLEELFSLAAPHEADRFMGAVTDAVRDRRSSVRVIATLRADFYDHPLRHGAFGELVRLGTEVITPMTAQELERAITGPAAGVGAAFEPGLVAAIAADMAGQSTALPLLQYALTELFERRSGNTITADVYDDLGGVSAALARRADAIYDDLPPDDHRTVRDVFLRLVTLNEGGADTRRRALIGDLDDGGHRDVAQVLDAFGRHRLLTFDRDAATRSPTVEIAHEALLTEWTRLRRWIDDARGDIRAERQLGAAAAEWLASGHDPDFLLAGSRLARYDGWSDDSPVPVTGAERDFLVASSAADAAELEVERRRVTRLRRLVIGVGVALVLALIAGGVALQQQRRADDEAQRAQASAADAIAQTEEAELVTLVSRSAAAASGDADLALLLALEAYRRAPRPDTEGALLNALGGSTISSRVVSRQPLEEDCSDRPGIFFSQLRGSLELAYIDGRLVGRDPLTGAITDFAPSPTTHCGGSGPARSLAYTDGTVGGMASSFGDIWVGPDFELELELPGPTLPLHFGAERFVGRLRDAPVALLYDTVTGEQIGSYGVDGHEAIGAFAYSEGLALAAISFERNPEGEGALVIIDAATGDELVRRLDVPRTPGKLRFDEVTGSLIMGFEGGRVLTVEPVTGEPVTEIQTDFVTGFPEIGVRDDGTLVLVGRDRIQLANRSTGPVGPAYEITNIGEAHVRPDGLVVTVDDLGQIDVYDLDAGSPVVDATWEVDPLAHRSIVDGRAVQLNRSGNLIETIDLASGDRTRLDLRTPDGDAFNATQVYAEPDGVWAISDELILARWEGETFVESLDMRSVEGVEWIPHSGKPVGSRFDDTYAVLGAHPDGSREASLVELTRGSPRVRFTVQTEAGWVHPTADGGMYAIDKDGAAVTYDREGEIIAVTVTGALDPNAATLDPTGRRLAIAGLSRAEVYVLDTEAGEATLVPGRLGIASHLGFNGDGSLLAMAMLDGRVLIYDVEANRVPVEVWDGSGTFDSEPGWFDEQTQSLWMNSSGSLLRIALDPAGWVERACDVVGRGFTQDEWDRFVPGGEPLRSVCD